MRGEKQRGYFRHGKSRDALTSYLYRRINASRRKRVDLEVKAPLTCRLFDSEIQNCDDSPNIIIHQQRNQWFIWFPHSFLVLGGELMQNLSFKSFPGICEKVAWYYPTCVSHPRPQVSDEIAPYFFCSQSQWLVYGLRHIFQLIMSGRVEIRENWYIFNFILLGTLYEIVRKNIMSLLKRAS